MSATNGPSFPQGEPHSTTAADHNAIADATASAVNPQTQTSVEARLAAIEAAVKEAQQRNVDLDKQQAERYADTVIDRLEKRGAFEQPDESPASAQPDTGEEPAQPPASQVVPPPEKKTLAQRFLGE